MALCNLATLSVTASEFYDSTLVDPTAGVTVATKSNATGLLGIVYRIQFPGQANSYILNVNRANANVSVRTVSIANRSTVAASQLQSANSSLISTTLNTKLNLTTVSPRMTVGLGGSAALQFNSLSASLAFLITPKQPAVEAVGNFTAVLGNTASFSSSLSSVSALVVSGLGVSMRERFTSAKLDVKVLTTATANFGLRIQLSPNSVSVVSNLPSAQLYFNDSFAPSITALKLAAAALPLSVTVRLATSVADAFLRTAPSANMNVALRGTTTNPVLSLAGTAFVAAASTSAAALNIAAVNAGQSLRSVNFAAQLAVNAATLNFSQLGLPTTTAALKLNFASNVTLNVSPQLKTLTTASNVLSVGAAFTVNRGLTPSTPAAGAVLNFNAPFLTSTTFDLGASSNQAKLFAAGNIDLTYRSIAVAGVARVVPVSAFSSTPGVVLNTLIVVSKAATATAAPGIGIQGLGASIPALACKLSAAGSSHISYRPVDVAPSLNTLTVSQFGTRLLLADSANQRAFVQAASSVSRADFAGELRFGQTTSSAKLNAQGLFLSVNVGMAGTISAVANPTAIRLGTTFSPVNLPAAVVGSVLSVDSTPIFGLNSYDYPIQLQEYAKYSLPTGTSLASPADSDGNLLYASGSVFGATLLRLSPGPNSTAAISARVRATQLGPADQYSLPPSYKKTMVFLRASRADSASLQRALFASEPVSAQVTRVADYANFTRSYTSSVASMGSGGNAVLSNPNSISVGTYVAPTTPVLFLGSSLVRHNYNQNVSNTENVAIATDYYYPDSNGRKLAKARIESTVSNVDEGLSPVYSSTAFRLMTPAQYAAYSVAGGKFKANAAILPQDGATAQAYVHASDSVFTFVPMKEGAKYAYSYHHPSSSVNNATVTAAEFLGFGSTGGSLEYTVGLTADSEAILPSELYSNDADCLLRLTLYPYTESGMSSFSYIDIPVLGISVNNPARIVIDSSYRWYLEQCLPGGAYADIHKIRSLKDFYSAQNNAVSVTSKAILAVNRPVVSINSDQGESAAALLSTTNDRNLILGEFSLGISRPDSIVSNGVSVNVEETNSSALEVYSGASQAAAKVSSFDPNLLHLFVLEDGTLAGRRAKLTYSGYVYTTDIDPVLSDGLKEFIKGGGLFSKVKVGENVTAVLSAGNTGKRLYLWGANTYGHLDVPKEVDPNFLSQGFISNVKDFDFHAGHIAVILDDGKLYGWGCKASTVWRTAGNVIKHLDIGKNYMTAIVERADPNNGSAPIDVIEQYGEGFVAPPVGLVIKAPTQVWSASSVGQTINAGKVLACGENHTVFLKSDGTVACWGNNTYGQCTVPGGLTSIIAVDAGDNHTIALKSDGTVYAWGRNNHNQTSIPAGLNAKIISAGGDFCAAIRSSSSTDVSSVVGAITDEEVEDTIACWGRNDKGQCAVPVCEGVSYDPSVHKYRMRFWSVVCGWDHAVGIRKDEVSAKWVRDHSELTRYIGSSQIKMPLKTSSGTTIFSCIRGLRWTSQSNGTLAGTSSTGTVYATGVENYGYYTEPVTVGAVKYRMKVSTSFDATTIQRSVAPFTTWTDLTFDIDQYDYAQTYTLLSTTDLYNLQLSWNGIPNNPKWDVRLDSYSYGFNNLDFVKAAQTTGEYVDLDYAVADVQNSLTDKRFVAWGNPMGFAASVDITQYQAYYPGTPLEDVPAALSVDVDEAVSYDQSRTAINKSFSYVGGGKQLGSDLYTGGLSASLVDTSLSSFMYLGPRSIQVTDLANGIIYNNPSTGAEKTYGYPSIYLSISGTPQFFNRPTAFTASEIKCFVSPENNTDEAKVVGFNNQAVYVEKFGYSLPSGYSIVANGDPALPAGTPNSATGYHILWSGTIASVPVTLVLTGGYAYQEFTEWGIRLPMDSNYANFIMPSAYLTALGLSLKYVRVVKHQLDYLATAKTLTPIKHATVQTSAVLGGLTGGIFTLGLAISSSSYQRSGDVLPLAAASEYNVLSVAAKYRSAMVIRKTAVTLAGKYGVTAVPMGDNTKGQLELRLVDKFGLTTNEMGQILNLNSNWMMDYGQANIGHSQNSNLAYGFKQVSCGQFHTLAIDDSGAVSAWGLNYGIKPPKTEFMLWDPFAFGYSACYVEGVQFAYVTGYFTSLSGEPSPPDQPGVNFNLNRAYGASSRPGGATNSVDLVDNVLLYPNAPAQIGVGCFGTFTTSGALFFDAGGFTAASKVLVSQEVFNDGAGFIVGIENSVGFARIYVTTSVGGPTYYSDPYLGVAKTVYVYFPNEEIGEGVRVFARINGTDITWNSGTSNTSDFVKCSGYAFFMDAVGSVPQAAQTRSTTLERPYQPTTSKVRMFAGDSHLGGVYNDETNPESVIRGSMISRFGSQGYAFVIGRQYPDNANNTNLALPAIDIEIPKDYAITKVARTYFNSTTQTNTPIYYHVCTSSPNTDINSSAYSPPSAIAAKPANASFDDTQLAGFENVIKIAAGSACYFAIKNSSPTATQGSLVAWGRDYGDGVLSVPSGSTYTVVSARDRHAAALRADGSIVCWGNNTAGQCNAPTGTGYTAVACGDSFTAAIDSAGKLVCWGSISTVPLPYANMTFDTVSCGKGHIVARTSAAYTENVPGGVFRVKVGDVIAFGDNTYGQCDIPGFSYGPNNKGLNAPAVAGGNFTAYLAATKGFKATDYVNSTFRTVVFTDLNPLATSQFAGDKPFLYRLEGYVVHRAGELCPMPLDKDHPWALNFPVSMITPARDPVGESIQAATGYLPIFNLTSNATNVPTAFRRGGPKKAKFVAAGRFPYYKQTQKRFVYGSGYSIIVGDDNQITVFGGDLLATGCNINSYSPPAEALAIRNFSSAGFNPDDVIVQLATFRGQVFTLKNSGDIAQWGYDDVSTSSDPEFYRINTVKKQYFSLPDDSIRDVLPRLNISNYANIPMSYVSGIPDFKPSWAVEVSLDRYFNGVKTNIRKFTATGKTPEYSIQNPIHFAETFLAIDTWPGTATGLDTQYVLSVTPYGVLCTINSGSMFLLNLDSKTSGNVRILNDANAMPSSLSQIADFAVVTESGLGFESNPLLAVGSVDVTAVTDSSTAITLSSSNSFIYPSYLRNSYGSSARLESLDASGLSANIGGRIANPQPVTPTHMSASCWYAYSSLPASTGAAITSWENLVSGGIALTQATANRQANVQTFNTSYRGAEFDTTTNQQDRMLASVNVTETGFTYFLVLRKANNSAATHCAFGKYINQGGGQFRVQGLGFSAGRPVLFQGFNHDVASTSIGTSNSIVCAYYDGASYKGLRVNGTAVSSYASTNTSFFIPTSQAPGYHLGSNIAGANGGTAANYHDSNDVYAEVVAFDRPLTLAEIQIVEGYLNNKFALNVLPSGHAYQTQPASRDTLTAVYNEGLEANDLIFESARVTGNAGRGETWLGMFEIGLNYRGSRNVASSDNHAPIIAEFDVLVNNTIGLLAAPITAISNAVGALLVDGNTKYLTGSISLAADVITANFVQINILTGNIRSRSNVTGVISVQPGLVGFAGSKLQFFGGTDCDGPYGCTGVSQFPPDLIVKKSNWVISATALKLEASAALSNIITVDFAPRINCKLQTAAFMSLEAGLLSSVTAEAILNRPNIRSITVDLGLTSVTVKSKVLVCLPNMLVTGRSSSNKSPRPIFPKPILTIRPDAIATIDLISDTASYLNEFNG